MSLEKIDAYVTKYMKMIGGNTPRPKIAIKNSVAQWLGQTHYSTAHPETTLIEIQKRILDDEKTLERVVAHEIVHHVNMMSMTTSDFSLLRLGIKPPGTGHGEKFMALAKIINNVMGKDFVTRESDMTYVVGDTKPFTLLIEPVMKTRLGYSIAVKISADAKTVIERKKELGAKTVTSTDSRWIGGVRIKKYGGVSLPPQGSENEKLLRELYEAA